jgi:hypothetical protein
MGACEHGFKITARHGARAERSGDPHSIRRTVGCRCRTGESRAACGGAKPEACSTAARRVSPIFLTAPSGPLHAERQGALAVDFAIGSLVSLDIERYCRGSPDEFFFTKIPLPSTSTGPNAPVGDVPAAMDAVRATRCFSIQGEQLALGCSQASKITGSCFTLHIPGEGPRKNGDTHGWLGKLYSE